MWALLASGDVLTWIVLAAGLACVAVGVLALGASQGKQGLRTTTAGLVLVILTGTLTVGGVMRSRLAVDHATEGVRVEDAALARKAIYDRTLGLSRLGSALGALGLLLGTVAGIRSATKDYESADARGEASEWTIPLGPSVLAGIALFTVTAAATPLIMGMPGRGSPAAQKKVAEAQKLLEDGNFAEGCVKLEEAFQEGATSEVARGGEVEGLVTECFNVRMERALGSPTQERVTQLDALKASKLPLEAGQRERLDAELARAKAEPAP